ncbi:glucokinase [Legionella waltersii]|uniref:Glucokinase n=1 Tax=Legionella waltersii TaxID=66969 RepID=A0A0W1A2S4_9GAMM|nr:glucokinase [Legionella waltersii]KTD75529.1 glucokinase [Legionella waltersii]SNU98510.1 glucokinase [Legionella waltersii]
MKKVDFNHYVIVADIGGTFARFARVDLTDLRIDHLQVYPCVDFISLQSAFLTYQAQYSMQTIKQLAVAIACPVLSDQVTMTNGQWSFSISKTKEELGLSHFMVMNDFSAIARSLPILGENEAIQIGQGKPKTGGAKVILGAGTGLGVSVLISSTKQVIPIEGEGGHASWGATSEIEWFIYSYLKKRFNHVSFERLLSGQGLENIYAALAEYHQQKTVIRTAAEIIDQVNSGNNELANLAVEQFFSCLGSYAGNLALTLSAFGGIYIAGGIVPRLLSVMKHSSFRSQFEAKGRFREFNEAIPTYVITAAQPGILGAAFCLKELQLGVSDVLF